MALLIVNADDFGLTPGVTRGIAVGHRDGVITSTSMLAVAPSFPLAAAMAASGDLDDLGIGVHLAAVGEDPPLLSAKEVPSLVDRRGAFWQSWRQFLPRVAAGRIDREDLRREFTAQVERARSVGVPLTHVDTHQHLHLWPLVRDVVIEVAATAGIDAIRATRTSGRGPKARGIGRLARGLADSAERAGMRHPRAFAGLDEAGHLTGPVLCGAIEALGASQVPSAEIGCHPGEADDPERRRYRWGYAWPEELAGLRSPAARTAIDAGGFRLGTFADL
jgi:predicted glycoside hydrolase/deacetylase ChbG (UPF0249 family)